MIQIRKKSRNISNITARFISGDTKGSLPNGNKHVFKR